MAEEWIDRGTYWLNTFSQGSERWHELRKGRLTASCVAGAIGHSRYSSPVETALGIIGKTKKEPNEAMIHGTKMEPIARKWYEESRKVKVNEVGIAIPKWAPQLGVSLDGEVGSDGAIEIKCPKKMYPELESHMRAVAAGVKFPRFYSSHIRYYDQVQLQLSVVGRSWCDYVVFCSESGKVFVDRVEFNQQYWEEILWPKIQQFLRDVLGPMVETPPIMPD